MVGGSSSSNATLYQRGSKADYDSWKMPGWTAKDALHYFIQCEDNHEGGPLWCSWLVCTSSPGSGRWDRGWCAICELTHGLAGTRSVFKSCSAGSVKARQCT